MGAIKRKAAKEPDRVGGIRSLLDEAEGPRPASKPKSQSSDELDLDAAWEKR